MQNFTVTLQLQVSDNWVADGVDFSDPKYLESLEEQVRDMLPFAHYEIEFKVKATCTKSPDKKVIDELQGN